MARRAATLTTPSPLFLLLVALVLLFAASLSEAFVMPVHSSSSTVAARRRAPTSSSSSPSIVSMSSSVEEGSSSPTPATTTPTESKAESPCKKYPKCNGAYLGKGCDGAGKIQGGIATFPLLGWWPIKAYRPCPALTEAGYGYKRKGQDFSEFIAGERRKRPEDDE